MQTRPKLHITLAEDLESRILSGEINIGDRLPAEGEIAREYGISTRSVREGIQILEIKGLVQRRHGERTLVVRSDVENFLGTLSTTVRQHLSSDPDAFFQLMDVRRMIEVEAASTLCALEERDLQGIEDALARMNDCAKKKSFADFTTADAEFHRELVKATGNDILYLLYNNLYGLITEVIKVSSRVPKKTLTVACREHTEIFDAIVSRDKLVSRRTMKAHIDNSSGYLLAALQKSDTTDNTDDE